MRKITVLFLLAALLLPACRKNVSYRDDLPVGDLAARIQEQIPVDYGYEDMGEAHLLYYLDGDDLPKDRCLRQSVLSEDINEFGVFYTPSDQARQELEEELSNYLEELREEKSAFVGSYAPAEVPKLDHASLRSFGPYTVYLVLSPHSQSLVWSTVESILRVN